MSWSPVRVVGNSMAPTLRAGDLLVVRTPRDGEPIVGQIVCVEMGAREVVKRVTRCDPGTVSLAGDNAAASTDSRTYGAIPVEQVTGIAVARYWPLWRARRLSLRDSHRTREV